MDGTILGKKYGILDGTGGSGGSRITNTTLKNVWHIHQTSVNETFSYTVESPAYLVVSLKAMVNSSITLTVNDYSFVVESGFQKTANAIIPVYNGDQIEFECISEGSDENLVCNIMLVNGLELPERH